MSAVLSSLFSAEQGFAVGDHEISFSAMDRVIKLGARTPAAFLARACALENCGHTSAALDDFLEAVASRPEQVEFKLRALRFAIDRGLADHAAQLASFWLRTNPANIQYGEFAESLKYIAVSFGYCELRDDVLSGWAISKKSKMVQLEIDGVYASVDCTRPTPEIKALGLGDGWNGFAVRLPQWCRSVRVGVGGQSLWGSPFANPDLPTMPPPKSIPVPFEAVDIIMPVYKGREETLATIHSVLSSANSATWRLIVVDDCSPDTELAEALRGLEREGHITLIKREINAGFIGAVQAALNADPNLYRDIVVLNADTLVHGDWIDRLQQVAYSDAAIATVTPLSNNAELLGYPEPHRPGLMPAYDALAILDGAARSSRAAPVNIPTGIGFCMYIRHDALRALGGFDESLLVRGYAEENDFCIRASEQGWRNVAAPNVFVAHRGEVSFGAEKRWLVAHNLRLLKARHPGHEADYDRFLARDPLAPIRRNLQRCALVPLLKHHQLTLLVTDRSDLAWRMGRVPEARLLITERGVVLEFRQLAGLGRLDYVGKRGLEECQRDLKIARFKDVVLQSTGAKALRLARSAGYIAGKTMPQSSTYAKLSTLPENAPRTRLLVPAPNNAEEFLHIVALAKSWLAEGSPHRIVVLGTTVVDEQLIGLPNVHVTGSLDEQEFAQKGITYLKQTVLDRLGINAIALHPTSSVRDWLAIADEIKLPLYRWPAAEKHTELPSEKRQSHRIAFDESHTFSGALLSLDGICVTGWAKNETLPGVPVVVELIADGLSIALVRADVMLRPAMPETTSMVSDYGFRCFLSRDVLRSIRSIRARIANSSHYLDGELNPGAADEDIKQSERRSQLEALRAVSYVKNHGGIRLTGIAVDASQPQNTLTVFAVFKGRRIAQALANVWAVELHDTPGINAAHGFSISMPLEFADGRQRIIHVVDEAGRALPGSPLTVCCNDTSVQSWVHSMKISSSDKPLLTDILKMAQRHVPLSIDFSSYPDWKQRFGSSSVRTSAAKVLVVLGTAAESEDRIDATLQSLLLQTHQDWIACVRGNGKSQDERLQYVSKRQWKTVLHSLLQRTDYTAVIAPGDTWHPHTLGHAVAALQEKKALVAYCDCDTDDLSQPPWFKPDWCPDTFLAQPLLHHGFVARSDLLAEVVDGDEPSDWPWLAAAKIGDAPELYAHVPHPHHTSTSGIPEIGKRASALVQQRFNVSLTRTRTPARHPLIHVHQINYAEPTWPRVTLIVPTRDEIDLLKLCIESLLQTDYPLLDLCVVDNGSTCKKTIAYLGDLPSKGVRVLEWPYPFNYSAINNFAVSQANGEVIGLINNDVEASDTGWLKFMITQLMRDAVGAVGAKLLWKNRMVQHGGVQLGLHGLAGHIGNNWLDSDPGYCGMNHIVRSTSAVTAACLLMRKGDYEQLGGLDENAFPVAFNDVDLCLRLRAAGKRIVWTPDAVLFHAESASRGKDQLPEKRARLEREKANLYERWGDALLRDPYYNPNLNLDQYSHTALALPPRHA